VLKALRWKIWCRSSPMQAAACRPVHEAAVSAKPTPGCAEVPTPRPQGGRGRLRGAPTA